MLLFKAFAPVVGALTELPARLFRLGEVPFRSFRPVRPGCFDLVEVWVRVPVDELLLGAALFVARRVFLALLVIAEVRVWHGWVVVVDHKERAGSVGASGEEDIAKVMRRAEE